MTLASATPETGGSTVARELLITLGWVLCVPVALTAMMGGTADSWGELGWTYVVNLAITLGIGGTVRGAYALVELGPISRWPKWVHHALALPAGLLIGTEISLAIIGLAMPFVGIGGGRIMLWRVGGVVSLAVVGVSGLVESWRARALANALAEAEARRDAVAAQLGAVQARVQPHFLFNALNTVAALIEEDPPLAVQAVERLSSLLRRALERAEDDEVPLRDELALTRDYVAIEALRFESRLVVEFDVEEAALDVPVPSFCVQPMVENAVRHGMAGRGTLHVDVAARLEGGRVVLRVVDDGRGISNQPGTARGRRDLESRLALMYGAEADLEAGPQPEGGYVARLRVPAQRGPA